MRALKIATIVMGVLIVAGTAGLVIGLVRRGSAPMMTRPPVDVAAWPSGVTTAVLDEPAGTRIVGIAAVRDRLALRLEGGGADRVVLIDPATGAVAGRVGLAR